MNSRYYVELHGGCAGHRTWRAVRRYDRCIMCVCAYKRGACRVCEELNALTSGKMGENFAEDVYVS